MGMTVGDASANKFKKGNWYKAIAIGYDAKDNEVGKSCLQTTKQTMIFL